MTHIADAVGMLLRQQSLRIHFLPGSPDTHYRVRAPALLTQLGDAVITSSGGRGGRTVPGSRAVADVDALELWHHIHTSVHGWAQELGVDRRPYLAQARAQAAEHQREPAWLRTLGPWLRPVAWDQPLDVPTTVEPAPIPEPAERIRIAEPVDPRELPAIGRLLRTTAAAAARDEQIARTITRRSWCGHDIAPADCTAGCWTHRIQGLLSSTFLEDREIRGASCWECRTGTVDPVTGTEVMLPTKTTLIEQDGEVYRVPAIVVRVAVLPRTLEPDEQAGPDDLWIYRMCRHCGAEGWLDYTTTTKGTA